MRRAALFLLLMGLLANGQEVWENNYDQLLHFKCPTGQSISYIKSQHHNDYEDRRWKFGCKKTFDCYPECFWSTYANDFDGPLKFECPENHIITGMISYHENKYEDRRWKFSCCSCKGYSIADCKWTTFVNWYDELFHWDVPNHNYLVGAQSYHKNEQEDRRWAYKYCAKT